MNFCLTFVIFVCLFFFFYFFQSMGGDLVEGVVGATTIGVALPTEAEGSTALSEGEQFKTFI